MRRLLLILLLFVGAGGCVVLVLRPELARACGGFFSARLAKDERKPALAYEQTLVIHDRDRHREHFIREVVFRTSRKPFGFVVPTAVAPRGGAGREESCSNDCERCFDSSQSGFVAWVWGRTRIRQRSRPGLGGVACARSEKDWKLHGVRSFGGRRKRRSADSLKKSPGQHARGGDAWLAHYVKMKFFYVAMRYDPPAGGDDAAVGRTEERDDAHLVRLRARVLPIFRARSAGWARAGRAAHAGGLVRRRARKERAGCDALGA